MGDYNNQNGSRSNGHDPVIEEIARTLRGLRYGSLEIVVHDSRVVQIERRERVRLVEPTPPRPLEERRAKLAPSP